ncbi:MAG: D-2-hydroxyacid dehydrogenase [Prevotellaceae bacterium]|jgi:glycerate dehydrogenase|nr:D-2-hydroxyacid dehydrogenase [Prevotellaceae bacterium]
MVRINKIVFLDAATVGPCIDLTKIENMGNFVKYNDTAPGEVIERLQYAEVAIVNKTKITEEIIRACPQLKLICVAATGMNNIDLDAAAAAGITVKNAVAYSTNSVVQHTFSMLLALVNKINFFDGYVKSGQYSQSSLFTSYDRVFSELAGKQVGIIGLGAIGKKSAKVIEAFDAQPVYYSTSGKNLDQPYPRLELNELLSSSDVILIHAPLNKATHNLIDEAQFRLMKPSAVLVNAGRGKIVNEQALAEAIDAEIIAGAALDVFAEEPFPADNPLLKVKYPERLILTPHIAWTSVEARNRLVLQIVDNIKAGW